MKDIHEVLYHFDGVKQTSSNEWMAQCPAHDDRNASLSISTGKDGKALFHCHAGCETSDILNAIGLTFKDIMPEKPQNAVRTPRKIVATYDYPHAQKIRYEPKSFAWRHKDSGGEWVYNRKDIPHELYIRGTSQQTMYFVEGEKDVDTMAKLGFYAACNEDGADKNGKGKWYDTYNDAFKGKSVRIIVDNDETGRTFSASVADRLTGITRDIKLFDLRNVWEDAPEHADITDYYDEFGADATNEALFELERITAQYSRQTESGVDDNKNPFVLEIRDNLSALIKPATQYSKKSVDWIIPQWIPKGVICVVYGDGGNGKSYTVLDIISKLSKGRATMLDTAAVTDRKPMTILYANHEDDIEAVTMSRLERAGADMQNIYIPNLDADTDNRIDGLRLTSEALRQAVETLKPDIVVLDPLQSFIPAETNMGARNQMRACFSPLEHMAHTYGTTFIVVCHTNKKGDAFGRNKISDSSDIWDIARAVMAVGKTKDKITKYISLEKSNYQSHPETVLFSITDAGVQIEGRTDKHECDFVLEMPAPSGRPSDKRDDCKAALLEALTDAPSGLTSSYLTDWLMEQGFSEKTVERAKSDLYKSGLITQERSRFGGSVMIKPTLQL